MEMHLRKKPRTAAPGLGRARKLGRSAGCTRAPQSLLARMRRWWCAEVLWGQCVREQGRQGTGFHLGCKSFKACLSTSTPGDPHLDHLVRRLMQLAIKKGASCILMRACATRTVGWTQGPSWDRSIWVIPLAIL